MASHDNCRCEFNSHNLALRRRRPNEFGPTKPFMRQLIVSLASAEATDADRFGPKAANLARLGRAGLPIPEGFCVDAEAYRIQVAALGLADSARSVSSADSVAARRAALAMKLGLLDHPIVSEVLDPLLDASRTLVDMTGALTV